MKVRPLLMFCTGPAGGGSGRYISKLSDQSPTHARAVTPIMIAAYVAEPCCFSAWSGRVWPTLFTPMILLRHRGSETSLRAWKGR